VKQKYTDKRLKLTISTEACFALGVIPNPGTLAGRASSVNRSTFLHSRQNTTRYSVIWNQNVSNKQAKTYKNPKEEIKIKPDISRERELAWTGRERRTTISQNAGCSART
jgi:hypothetical protein